MKQKFEFPLPAVKDAEDMLMKGEYIVILELLSELPGAKEGKEKVLQGTFQNDFVNSLRLIGL